MIKPIFVTKVGSQLYGTAHAQSDIDFKGFCFEDFDQIYGLKTFEQQQYSNNKPDGPDKVEGSVFSVRYFIKKCLTGNPTVIEIAFADSQYWMHHTEIGKDVAAFIRDNMLTKHLFVPYSAYHRAQLRKLQSQERVGKRKEIVETFGFDVKFAGHAYRLARQCQIVFSEGVLRPTLDRPDIDLIKEIYAGKYNKDQALEILKEADVKMYETYKASKLPERPDFNYTNAFVMNIYKNYINGHYDEQLKDVESFAPFECTKVLVDKEKQQDIN